MSLDKISDIARGLVRVVLIVWVVVSLVVVVIKDLFGF